AAVLRLHLLQQGKAGERFDLCDDLRPGRRTLPADGPGRTGLACRPVLLGALPGQDQPRRRPDQRVELREYLPRLVSLFGPCGKQRRALLPLDGPRRDLLTAGSDLARPGRGILCGPGGWSQRHGLPDLSELRAPEVDERHHLGRAVDGWRAVLQPAAGHRAVSAV